MGQGTRTAWLRMRRTEAWGRQDTRCLWCRSGIARDQVTAEHMHVRSQGGSDEAHNITAACQRCNQARGSLPASKFRSMLRSRASAPLRRRIRERQIVFRVNKRAEQACRRIRASVDARVKVKGAGT